ncbi:MAG: cobalamin-dependent protein, partial [Candidatus Bathyarchaeota archaeon]|nr:cobalamin-dependent protein [Candidatus Bathyarchaeota archaeon]
ELENSGKIKKLVNKAVSNGIPATDIVERGLRIGLDSVGKRYEAGEYFLSELLFAAALMNDALEILEPRLRLEEAEKKGIIVIGTVRGDIHDIGKNIFKMFAQATGFEVHDLGVDVEPETFIEKLKETDAEILGLSTLLTTTRGEMRNVLEQLTQAGIRDKVKVLLGGNAVTKGFAREIEADEAALDVVEGIEICKKWVMEK